jgi:hypothetical protein
MNQRPKYSAIEVVKRDLEIKKNKLIKKGKLTEKKSKR